MLRLLCIAVLSLLCAVNSIAQKYGHINSRTVIDSLHESKKILEQLGIYEKALGKTGEEMVQKFESNLANYRKEISSGNVPPVRQKEMESNLEMEQDAIAKYQRSAKESLDKRREELLAPMLERVDATINDLAKNEGFNLIFDSSVGFVHYDNTFDLTYRLIKILNTPK